MIKRPPVCMLDATEDIKGDIPQNCPVKNGVTGMHHHHISPLSIPERIPAGLHGIRSNLRPRQKADISDRTACRNTNSNRCGKTPLGKFIGNSSERDISDRIRINTCIGNFHQKLSCGSSELFMSSGNCRIVSRHLLKKKKDYFPLFPFERILGRVCSVPLPRLRMPRPFKPALV
jgi:hypothetical protein